MGHKAEKPGEMSKEIGRQIRIARTELDMSQKELIERTGYSKSTISRTETGDRVLTYEELGKIARSLDLKPSELAGRADEAIERREHRRHRSTDPSSD